MPLATPTLSISDAANGTGGTATIASATAGTTNTVMGANFDGSLELAAFTSLGSRVGNGTLALAVANGYHWAFVKSTDGVETVVSSMLGWRSTSGATAVLYQILLALQAVCQAMTFTGISPANVLLRKLPINPEKVEPAIFIYPVADQQSDRVNARDDYGYGIGFVAIQKSNASPTVNLDRLTMWRQQLNRAFRNGRNQLSAIAEITGEMRIEPGMFIVPSSWQEQFDVTNLTLRVWTRETRGLT